MLNIVTKILGLVVVFFVLKGATGRAKEGDLTKFFMALGAYLLLSFSPLLFKA